MAYDRTGTGPWPWIKSVGSQGEPLRPNWRVGNDYLCHWVWFSKHPRSLRAGDALVYYAARWQVFPALMELAADDVDEDEEGHPVYGARWRWRMRVRPRVLLELRAAPSLAETTIDPLRLRRQSHIRLTDQEYDELRTLILRRADEESSL